MLKHSIRKPGVVMGLLSRFNRPTQHDSSQRMPISKVEFIKWIEENITPNFKVGDYVANSYAIASENTLPYTLYKIKYINELYHEVHYDHLRKQPRVLLLENVGQFHLNDTSYRCIADIRKLTEKELQLVQLQNQKAQGNA